MASSDDNGEGRGFAVEKTTPSIFPRDEKILSQKLIFFAPAYIRAFYMLGC